MRKGEAEVFAVFTIVAFVFILLMGYALFGNKAIAGPNDFNARILAADMASTMSEMQFLEKAAKEYAVRGRLSISLNGDRVEVKSLICPPLHSCVNSLFKHSVDSSKIMATTVETGSSTSPLTRSKRTIICLKKENVFTVTTCEQSTADDCQGFCDLNG